MKLALLSGSYLSAGGLEPSVAQPPLPLQEFLPLQPLSLALQPPLPLHEFWPLQACFSFTVFWSWDWSCALNEDLIPGKRFDAWIVAPLPASKPASAAPAIKAFFDLVIFADLPPVRKNRYQTTGPSGQKSIVKIAKTDGLSLNTTADGMILRSPKGYARKLLVPNGVRRSSKVQGEDLQTPRNRHGRGRIAHPLVACLILQVPGNRERLP